MTSFDAMHGYYEGQKMVAIAGAIAAAVLLLIAWAAYGRATYPTRAFGIGLFLIAGLASQLACTEWV